MAHTRSFPPLNSLPKVALETVSMFVEHRPFPTSVGECRPLPFSTPLFFGRSRLWCYGLSMFRKSSSLWTPLPCRPDVIISPVLASLSARSFPVTLACPGQTIHRSLCSRRRRMAVCQSGQLNPDSTFCMRGFILVYENDGICDLCVTLGG